MLDKVLFLITLISLLLISIKVYQYINLKSKVDFIIDQMYVDISMAQHRLDNQEKLRSRKEKIDFNSWYEIIDSVEISENIKQEEYRILVQEQFRVNQKLKMLTPMNCSLDKFNLVQDAMSKDIFVASTTHGLYPWNTQLLVNNKEYDFYSAQNLTIPKTKELKIKFMYFNVNRVSGAIDTFSFNRNIVL